MIKKSLFLVEQTNKLKEEKIMKKNLKKMLALLIAGTFVLGCLTGCGGENEEATSASENVETTETVETEVAEEVTDYKDVEFRVAWWGGDARHSATMEWLEGFEKDYPNLSISVDYTGYGDYFTKLTTQAAGGELPDVFQMDYEFIKSYADNGLLLPLEEYVESGALDLSNVSDVVKDGFYVSGQMYGVVTGSNTVCFAYNPAILEEVGVTISETPTIEEYQEVCKKVYDATGAIAAEGDFPHFSRAMGEEWYTDDGKALACSEETIVSFLDYWAEGVDYGYFAGPDTVIEDVSKAFAEGKVWCSYIASNQLASLEQTSGLDLRFMALPCSDANRAAAFLKPSMLWVISSTCENKELAVELINDFVNNTAVYDISGMDRGMPISAEIIEYMEPKMSEGEKEMVDFLNSLEKNGFVSAVYPAPPEKSTEARSILFEYIEQVKFGTLSKDDYLAAAEDVVARSNELLGSVE